MIKKNIKRDLYLNQIKPFIQKNIIKVLVGQRRVGKSYILLQIIDLLKEKGVKNEEIIFISKENLQWDFVKNYQDLYEQTKDFEYIFIDEIQDILEWEKAIRSLQAEGKDIYITGSNSNLLSSELATFLSGRYVSFSIYPLNYQEFLNFHNLENTKKSFEKYITFGGMPYLGNLDFQKEAISQYLKDIIDTIILNDVISRFKIRNIDFFKKLILFLAKEIGNIFSAKSISDYLKSQKISLSPNIILEYLFFAGNACFLKEVSRQDLKGKKIFEIKQKYYFNDIGIRNALVGGFSNFDIGAILENIIYINLISYGFQVLTGEINGKEIDFIAEKNGKKIYIQVCYILSSKEVIKREFGVYKNISDNWPKYVVSLDENTGGFIDGIEHLNIRNFILEKLI